ncbi:MAG: molybdenum cofactor guanylyltransferase [Kangiellaceae bacterium]|nr:molybdenum cofactor guanylyltransferase [Kangiellaceae bacterium]
MLRKEDITGLILAGGKGSRVNGNDKGLMLYLGRPLIEQQIEWLRPQVSTIIISANRNLDYYATLGYPVVSDSNDEFRGPMHGVFQAIKKCSSHYLYVHPVDMPNLPDNLIHSICAVLFRVKVTDPNNERLSFYLKSKQREHYLSMLISANLVEELKEFLTNGGNRVRDFHQTIASLAVALDLPESAFLNLNHSREY